jgi:hypothetical protein
MCFRPLGPRDPAGRALRAGTRLGQGPAVTRPMRGEHDATRAPARGETSPRRGSIRCRAMHHDSDLGSVKRRLGASR